MPSVFLRREAFSWLRRPLQKPIAGSVSVGPRPEDDSGSFIALVPDLPGCMSDGEPPKTALASVQDAATAWIEEAAALGRPVPRPSRHLVAAE